MARAARHRAVLDRQRDARPGGAGLTGKQVTLAFSGTWEFPASSITGITTASAQGTKVYITSGGQLTGTSTSNVLYGSVDYPVDYDKTRGFVPVKIGNR